jgi:hypothetical protein
MILNLDGLPHDPIEQIMWLKGVKAAVARELDEAYAEAYFNARLTGRFDSALRVGVHGKKKALALTRAANNRRARQVRWGDGIDPTSRTSYRGAASDSRHAKDVPAQSG